MGWMMAQEAAGVAISSGAACRPSGTRIVLWRLEREQNQLAVPEFLAFQPDVNLNGRPKRAWEKVLIAETPQILLRKLESADAPALHPVFADPRCTRLTLRIHADAGETLQWIEAVRRGYEKRGFGPWAVVRKDGEELIGYCGCGVIRLADNTECEIGYRIVPWWWGRGFATEAVGACLGHAFANLPYPRIIALIQSDNIASVRVAEKAGMRHQCDTTYEGVSMGLYEAMSAARLSMPPETGESAPAHWRACRVQARIKGPRQLPRGPLSWRRRLND